MLPANERGSLVQKMRLKQKTVIQFVLCAILPLAIGSVASFMSARETMRQEVSTQLQNGTGDTLRNLEVELAGNLTDLAAWSRLRVMQDVLIEDDSGEIKAAMTSLQQQYPDFESLLVTDQGGRVVAATDDAQTGSELGDLQAFSSAMADNIYTGPFGSNRLSASKTVLFAVPVRADYDAGTIIGSVIGVIDWTRIRKRLERAQVAGGQQNADRVLLLHDVRSNETIYLSGVANAGIWNKAAVGLHGSGPDGHDVHNVGATGNVTTISRGGQTFLLTMTPSISIGLLEDPNWTLHAAVSADVAYAGISKLAETYFIVGAIALLAALVLGWFAANSVVRPIMAMKMAVGMLAGGDSNHTVPGGDRKDEIGEMARALEQIRAVGIRAAQAQSSLDDASSPMMIVGTDGRVIFPNKAMRRLFKTLGANLRSELDGFASDVLTGTIFDRLHNLAEMRIEHLNMQDEPLSARMIAGGHTIRLTASPVFNEKRDRLGAVIEWQDLTAQVAVETEIAGIVTAAGEGDFSQRLREADKTGFMADLAHGMNELLDVTDNGLDQVVKVVSAMAEGDLSKRMNGRHMGAFLQLQQDVDRMGDQMEEIVGRIADVSGAVQTATEEISSGITDLSTRTEHQASSLEETTASMEELSATVRQNADNAQEANLMAAGARKLASDGGDVVERTVAAMGSIEGSAKKITEITALIQEIAFQTNLLALNASVEAARAGEAGRGFAVVANEVRALAQRAAAASKDIKDLIANTGSQVQEGVRLAGEAGGALEEIVTSVKKVADFVSEIAAASQEQTSGIEQVSSAVTSMDETTQQNASLVEETTATIQSAAAQMVELQQAVGFFKTANNPNVPVHRTDNEETAVDGSEMPLRVMARRRAAHANTGDTAIKPIDAGWEEF